MDGTNVSASDMVSVALKDFGSLFYMVNPYDSMFKEVDEVPHYVDRAVPFFVLLIFMELAVSLILKKPKGRVNDGIGSLSAGILSEITSALVFPSIQTVIYSYCYDHFHLIDLDHQSVWTWVIGLLCVDLGYYWFHRMAHEVNLFWASHVVHHSSEEYNLTTALRQSVTQNFVSWMFYLPFTVALPPSIYFVHKYFNLLFQFWIHTETVGKLGFLEYFLNTPSHHRVHHGRNPYCIDKNYAGVLIIWDRMFGTFEEESDSVVYGLTHNIETFDPIYIQFHHFWHIFTTAYHTPGLLNKLSVVFKGPGWGPGKPRMGLPEDIPYVERPSKVYNPKLPASIEIYLLVQFVSILLLYVFLIGSNGIVPTRTTYSLAICVVISLVSLGAISDRRRFSLYTELLRVILIEACIYGVVNKYIVLDSWLIPEYVANMELIFPYLLAIFGACIAFLLISVATYTPKKGDMFTYRTNEIVDFGKPKRYHPPKRNGKSKNGASNNNNNKNKKEGKKTK